MAALVLIYALIVWEFKNFTLAGLIMAPIPLTLIGIVPGHLIISAEFTATSMIGFIALAGIIVRNSILLVEFVKHEISAGKDIAEAVITAGQIRMRPILITAGTLMVGAAMLFSDPIFVGMAASLFFGTLVATVLTLVVIPLGCISVRKQFYVMAGVDLPQSETVQKTSSGLPLWLIIWSKVIGAVMWLFYIVRMFYFMAQMAYNNIMKRFRSKPKPRPDDRGPDDPGPGTGGGSPPPATPTAPAATSETQAVVTEGRTSAEVAEVQDTQVPTEPAQATETEKPVAVKKKAARRNRTAAQQSSQSQAAGKKKTTAKKRRGIKLKDI